MNITELQLEYQNLTKICAETNYSEKKSVRKNNSAVSRMYGIVNILAAQNNEAEIIKFAELLTVSENRTNLWVATQMLEKLNIDKKIEQQTLKIIEKVAKGKGTDALGYQIWLNDYKFV